MHTIQCIGMYTYINSEQGFKFQETLFEFFGDMCSDSELGEEDSQVDSSEGGRKQTGQGEVRKRRRRGEEPLLAEDPDFVVKAQKLKLSHKRDCPSVDAASPKKHRTQRTLTSMYSEAPARGKGKGKLAESAEQSKNNRSAALAGYVLSQHSRHTSADTSQESDTYSIVEGPSAGGEESDAEPRVLVARNSTGVGGVEGDEDMEWFKDLDESDFVSFDDFEDDV